MSKKTVVRHAPSTEGLSAQDKKALLWMGLALAVGLSLLAWAITGFWWGVLLWLGYMPWFGYGLHECRCDDEVDEPGAAGAHSVGVQAAPPGAAGEGVKTAQRPAPGLSA